MNAVCPDQEFQKHLSEGRFMLQRSASSGRHVFYPRVAEPTSGRRDLEWVEASGRGHVYATTVVRTRPPAVSYNVALIELQEGPRLMSRVEGIAPEAVKIGMSVKARIVDEDGFHHLVFDPVDV